MIMGSSQKEAQTYGQQLRKKVKDNLRQLEVTSTMVESDKDIMATFGHIIIPWKTPPPLTVHMPPLAPKMHTIRPRTSEANPAYPAAHGPDRVTGREETQVDPTWVGDNPPPISSPWRSLDGDRITILACLRS